MKGNLVRVK